MRAGPLSMPGDCPEERTHLSPIPTGDREGSIVHNGYSLMDHLQFWYPTQLPLQVSKEDIKSQRVATVS